MQRNAQKALIEWKNCSGRKPLLLYGARQVGKTYLIKAFSKAHYQNIAYFDLEKQASARAVFDGDLEPMRIIERLGSLRGGSIDIRSTLIVLDEIQASNRALASLKYFEEEMPEVHLVCAGSLLGIAVNREGYSAPVGKVDTLTLFPMSFDEFLGALDEGLMVKDIKACYEANERYFLHDKALDYYRAYLLVGGMPEVVNAYRENKDFTRAQDIQQDILSLYLADMAKYAKPYETARITEVWNSIPSQLAKENKKFQYKVVKAGGRASQNLGALQWLEQAGLINRCVQANAGQMPLALHESRDNYKVFQSDTGLLSARIGLSPLSLFDEQGQRTLSLGALVENYVAQALATNRVGLHYWTSDGKAEVDFLFEDKGARLIPLEVKSSDNVRSKSLSVFMQKYQPEIAYRLSTKNFGFENGIKSIPLYAAFCIGNE